MSKLSDRRVVDPYVEAGKNFAMEELDVPGLGESSNFMSSLNEWVAREADYYNLGYKPLPLELFKCALNPEFNLDRSLYIPVTRFQPVKLYAHDYRRDHQCGRIEKPGIDMKVIPMPNPLSS